MKKLTALLLAVILVLGLAACAAPAKQDTTSKTEPAAAETTSTDAATTPETEASGDTVTLKFACDDTQSSSYYIALEQFEKEVEEKTNGAVQVELYGDAQLGNATDTIEGMQLGTIECAFASTAAVSQFVPEFYYVDALKEKGVEFIDLDKAELQAKVEPVYEKYADKLPADIMEKIRNT